MLGAAVLELLDSLGIERASYAGLSLGGAVGQWLGINAPDRLDRLALLCTASTFPTPDSWRERAQTVRAEGLEAIAEASMGRWFTEDFHAQHADEVDRWRAKFTSTPAEGYAGCCEALASYDVTNELGKITASTLVIAGSDDPSTTPEKMRELAEAIPGSQFEVVPQSAHLAPVEAPEMVSGLLRDHFGSGAP